LLQQRLHHLYCTRQHGLEVLPSAIDIEVCFGWRSAAM
jgi:hypothetical protein